jgi:ketosteroid isomerase-like protein
VLLPLIFDSAASPTKLTHREITAQDNRVSLVADGTMPLKSGGTYDQTYHSLFKFRDDKVLVVLEYVDILAVWKVFGTPSSGPSPRPRPNRARPDPLRA